MNHRPRLSLAILAIAALGLTGCATIFSGTSDSVTFQSQPEGARVIIDGVDQGTTPLTTSVKRSIGGTTVTYRLDGYETRTFELGQEFNMTAIWNIFCLAGFWACGAIDVLTGAIMKYSPTTYDQRLDRREDFEEALEVDRVYFEHELNRDVIGARSPDDVVQPNVAIVNSVTKQVLIFR